MTSEGSYEIQESPRLAAGVLSVGVCGLIVEGRGLSAGGLTGRGPFLVSGGPRLGPDLVPAEGSPAQGY